MRKGELLLRDVVYFTNVEELPGAKKVKLKGRLNEEASNNYESMGVDFKPDRPSSAKVNSGFSFNRHRPLSGFKK